IAVPLDPTRLAQKGCQALCRRQGPEVWPLDLQSIHGALTRGAVTADIGHRIKPVERLSVEVRKIRKRLDPRPEVALDVLDAAFDLAICLRPVSPASLQIEAQPQAEVPKALVPDRLAAFPIVLKPHELIASDTLCKSEVAWEQTG